MEKSHLTDRAGRTRSTRRHGTGCTGTSSLAWGDIWITAIATCVRHMSPQVQIATQSSWQSRFVWMEISRGQEDRDAEQAISMIKRDDGRRR